MGAIHSSIDPQLVKMLTECLPLTTFMETGTFRGDSIAAVRGWFDEIYSVELSEPLHHQAAERFTGDPAVHVLHGDSPAALARLTGVLRSRSVLYWLDAHWSLGDTAAAGKTFQCPLLGEIEAIGALNRDSVLLIDDARYFLCPPPAPHDIGDWPSLDAVLKRLFRLNPDHGIMVLNDVIVCFPRRIEPVLREFAHRSSVDWLRLAIRARRFDGLYGIARHLGKGMFATLLGKLRKALSVKP